MSKTQVYLNLRNLFNLSFSETLMLRNGKFNDLNFVQ